MVKNPPVNSGDVRNMGLIPGLGRSLEKEMATCSSILVWQIPWQRSLACYTVHGVPKSWAKWSTHTHTQTLALFQAFDFISYI